MRKFFSAPQTGNATSDPIQLECVENELCANGPRGAATGQLQWCETETGTFDDVPDVLVDSTTSLKNFSMASTLWVRIAITGADGSTNFDPGIEPLPVPTRSY